MLSSSQSVNTRALSILRLLVERYIRDGQPVGSKAIAQNKQVALSPASIRNIMAELEASGYLVSPHTSAGRIPTAKGYRLFVDTLLTSAPLKKISLPDIETQFAGEADPKVLVETASQALSSVTQLAGVVSLPKHKQASLTHVEFLPLSPKRILVVLVFNETDVQNRIININKELTVSQLQQAGNYLTENFAGKPLANVRRELLAQIDWSHLR